MEHDDEIEKISKELENMLKMTSDEKENTAGETDLKENENNQKMEPELIDPPKIHLLVPVEGMEELYEEGPLESDENENDLKDTKKPLTESEDPFEKDAYEEDMAEDFMEEDIIIEETDMDDEDQKLEQRVLVRIDGPVLPWCGLWMDFWLPFLCL